jgi:peptide deformylase
MSDDVGHYFASKAAALSAGKAAEQAAEEVARSEIAARRAAATAAFNDVVVPHLESAATKIAHQGGSLSIASLAPRLTRAHRIRFHSL